MRYEGEADAVLNAAGDGALIPPRGILGGENGTVHEYSLHHPDGRRAKIGPRDAGVIVRPGDVIECISAGGGGYGSVGISSPT
jgi:N-methylhydantoinase B